MAVFTSWSVDNSKIIPLHSLQPSGHLGLGFSKISQPRQGDTVRSAVGSELRPKGLNGLHSTVSQAWTARNSKRQQHVPYTIIPYL